MPIFRCLILGENFPTVDDDGERELIGFYTYRYVESSGKEEAEILALSDLRQNEWLQNLKDLVDPEEPETRVHFEEIVEVESSSVDGTGFSFFPMNENSAN